MMASIAVQPEEDEEHTADSVKRELIKHGRCHICGSILSVRTKFGLGTKIINRECPHCARERAARNNRSGSGSSNQLSTSDNNDEIRQELSNLTTMCNDLSQELGGRSRDVDRLQSELEQLKKGDIPQGEEVLDHLVERAVPKVVERIEEKDKRKSPPQKAATAVSEDLALLKVNLGELLRRFDEVDAKSQAAVQDRVKEVVEKTNNLEIKIGKLEEDLQQEISRFKAEVEQILNPRSSSPGVSEDLFNELTRRLAFAEAKLEEQEEINRKQDEINRRQEEINRQQAQFNREILERLRRLEEAVELPPLPGRINDGNPGTIATAASSFDGSDNEWNHPERDLDDDSEDSATIQD